MTERTPTTLTDEQDALYLKLKGARERLCVAQMLVPAHWRTDIGTAIHIIDEVGSTLHLLAALRGVGSAEASSRCDACDGRGWALFADTSCSACCGSGVYPRSPQEPQP